MPESRRYSFDDLATADLVVDALYAGGKRGNTSDDPLGKLLPCGNQGGFRFRNRRTGVGKQFVVLYSDLSDNDWPDVLDVELVMLIALQNLLTVRKRLLGLIGEFLEIHVPSPSGVETPAF